jgi:hypothetical protein
MKRTGSFATALVEWERFQEGSKTWPEWKSHMIEAYELRETAGITATQGGYYPHTRVTLISHGVHRT